MLAPALGLDLITPPSFLKAISEGTDVSAADKQTIDDQIKNHEIKIYVYNSQNVTPDVQAQLAEVKAQTHPVRDDHRDPRARRARRYQEWQTDPAASASRPRWRTASGELTSAPTAAADIEHRRHWVRSCRVGTTAERGSRRRPAVQFEDAAVRLGHRTIWSDVTLSVGARRVRRGARTQRCRQVHSG